ncbi:MAG: biopolymer transporter ExbD [Chitinophagales bacterium]|nr:biopolymer transporter ExbD [Chitinophagales bacterium]
MAELEGKSESHGKKKGGARSKKMSTRIDMTPMVDLAFLLVTFFMLTTTFSKPTAMEVVMPDKKKPQDTSETKVRESEAMTVIMDKNNRIYYYFGITNPQVQTSNYSAKGIRQALLDKDAEVRQEQAHVGRDQNGVVVLIKPTNQARYQNLVDILDEMKIAHIKRYAIVDVTPDELTMLPQSQ